MHWRRKWHPTPVFLPEESQGRGSLVAAVSGVTQSRTRLKQLSSSSSSMHVCVQLSPWLRLERICLQFRGPRLDPWVLKIPCRREWLPSPVSLPGKSRGQRSPGGLQSWGLKESDMTERLHFHFSLSCIGKGNGNPLQCFCLENPREGGAWWAAVYGAAQSWT